MPVKGKIRLDLSLDTILGKVSEYDIYRFYTGTDFVLGRAFISPFRKESNPSFSVNIGKSGSLTHMDFADSSKRGDCVDFVSQLYGLDYPSSLERIAIDMGITGGTPQKRKSVLSPEVTPRIRLIQVVTRKFNTEELKYWMEYGINQYELRDNGVYGIKTIYLDRRRFPLPKDELAFAYLFDDKWKIYRPFADKASKWMGNVSHDRMSGMHRITPGCDTGVVTKSKKDEILLAKFLPNVCSTQSESVASINGENISFLKSNCKKVYLNFDSDEAGVQSCKFYNQFGFGWINCPKGIYDPNGKMIKDFADLARYHGIEKVVNHFKVKGII